MRPYARRIVGHPGTSVYHTSNTQNRPIPTHVLPKQCSGYTSPSGTPNLLPTLTPRARRIFPTGLECRPLTPHRARLHYSERLWKRLLSQCLTLAVLGALLGLLYGAIAGGLDRDARLADPLRSEVAGIMGGAR